MKVSFNHVIKQTDTKVVLKHNESYNNRVHSHKNLPQMAKLT